MADKRQGTWLRHVGMTVGHVPRVMMSRGGLLGHVVTEAGWDYCSLADQGRLG